MAARQRKKADDTLVLALACGATVDNAARQCGLTPRTVYRRLENPDFKQRLQQVRADMVQRTAGALTAASTEAVRAMLELLKPATPPATRLAASRSVLEIGQKLRESTDFE